MKINNPLMLSFPRRRESSEINTPRSGQNHGIDPLCGHFNQLDSRLRGNDEFLANELSGMKTKLLCAICSLVLLACGKTEQSRSTLAANQTVTTNTSISAPQATKLDALKIKSLYIGMDIQSVPNAMMAILAEQQLSDFGFTDVIKAGDGTQCVLMYTKSFLQAIDARMHERYGEARAPGKTDEELATSCINSDGVLTAKSGPDNKVARIEFNDVKDMFNAKDLSPSEFVKRLSKEYHILELKPNEAQTAWSFISPDGTKVEVDAKEVLGIPMVRLYMSKAAP